MILSVGGTPVTYGGKRLRLPMPRISVSGKNFIRNGQTYNLWGWHSDVQTPLTDPGIIPLIQTEMRRIRRTKANLMRIFTQMWDFVSGPDKDSLVFNSDTFANLKALLDAAKDNNLYIKLCGANIWTPADAPEWFDALGHEDRWDAQAAFYTHLVTAIMECGHASTIFAYDLVGEPVVKTDPDYPWYGEESYPGVGGGVSGLYFNPCIARGPTATDQSARDFITQLSAAIKAVDPRALCPTGTLPFVGGAFGRDNAQDVLDFVSPHIYPGTAEDIQGNTPPEQAQGWAAATCPVVCGEFYAWSDEASNEALLDVITADMQGVVSWNGDELPDEIYLDPSLPFLDLIVLAIQQYNTRLFLSVRDEFLTV